ncbi:putative Zinc finger protein [Quillaja saponaria]|uniref:Zinc finger protein n=1 Tax=Quillaja saponaria TaxID=32244 RepID=A0AAD7PIG3_QUISA|nr:putative Zinc finger protein [Quillaja saponaria]
MAGGDSPLCVPDKKENENDEAASDNLSNIPLVDAPILLFVCFHKALRAELTELRCLAETASLENGSGCRELILELQTRFEFLKLTYKYHCAAEDEVIFFALDMHMKNVACTYSLEHKDIDDLFDTIFDCLNDLTCQYENISKLFQELVCCIDTMETSIYQHMLKEEKQVFPLLMQQFSPKEQASLVWQFICTVPVMLMEEILPWMIAFLSGDKQLEVVQCLKVIVPKDNLLQEVLIAWLASNNPAFTSACSKTEGVQCADVSVAMKNPLRLHSLKRSCIEISKWMKANCRGTDDGVKQVDVLHLWHGAIRKDLKDILEELYQLKNSSTLQNLDSIVIQLKFLADVIIFYSNAQQKLFYPVFNEFANGRVSDSNENFPSESNIGRLQQLLFIDIQNGMPLCNFIEKLCRELEDFEIGVNRQFSFQETEVIPIISKNCCHGMQDRLLYMSLLMMPLGLLKFVITWFSAHLSENESRFIVYSLKKGTSLVHKSFTSLLHEWFLIGNSGKASIEKFQDDLQQMLKSRFSFLSEHIKEVAGYIKPCKGSTTSFNKGKSLFSYSSGSDNVNKYDMPYSSAVNMHIFFPGTMRMLDLYPRCHVEKCSSSSDLNDPKPIDIIFFFHKAIKKDLDYLVVGSAQLNENAGLLTDFCKRFHLIRFLYQILSDAEDEIAFPALEGKGTAKNISLSYTIDHKLELKHFSRLSLILDEISELHLPVSCVDSSKWDQRMLKHHALCRKLHEMCTSMHKLLSDHVNREEIEIWSLFRECFSQEEQGKIIGCMLGRIRAEVLQDMIPWLMESLTQEEQHVLMLLWSMATKNTKFDEWLREWWGGYRIDKVAEGSNNNPSWNVDPMEIITTYLSKEVLDNLQGEIPSDKSMNFPQKDHVCANCESQSCNDKGKGEVFNEDQDNCECSKCTELSDDSEKNTCNEVAKVTSLHDKKGPPFQACQNSRHNECLVTVSQEDLETAVRRVSCDSSLDPQKKSYIMQNLLMSRWIIRQKISHSKVIASRNEQEFPGQHPSYKDSLKLAFGCKHYKRNCKLLADCCNQLYTCIRCHDEIADHSIDRNSITKMMCMKCLMIQPIGATCSRASCNNLSMARYYCRICRLFDDDREIYHCPYCNLCRVGKGLGIDYFHCMNCNACMSRSLSVHICREKCFEDNCPICHEFIFTSCSPVKALPCGHLMHSACFQDYTSTHYTCPICNKSLGDMQVYFRMLDALLAEEKTSDEFAGQTQVILCNDCEKKGVASFHWLYHKCSFCGSYNTRVL